MVWPFRQKTSSVSSILTPTLDKTLRNYSTKVNLDADLVEELRAALYSTRTEQNHYVIITDQRELQIYDKDTGKLLTDIPLPRDVCRALSRSYACPNTITTGASCRLICDTERSFVTVTRCCPDMKYDKLYVTYDDAAVGPDGEYVEGEGFHIIPLLPTAWLKNGCAEDLSTAVRMDACETFSDVMSKLSSSIRDDYDGDPVY